MNTQTGFVNSLGYMRERQYDAFATYIQAVLETGNFVNTNATQYNNFFNQYHYRNDGWTGKTHIAYDKDKDGNIIAVEAKVYDTPLDCLMDYNEYIQKKFPLAYADRANYQKFFTEIMTIGKDDKGKPLAIYPSFCVDVNYSKNLINLYEKLKSENHYELYQSIHGNT